MVILSYLPGKKQTNKQANEHTNANTLKKTSKKRLYNLRYCNTMQLKTGGMTIKNGVV